MAVFTVANATNILTALRRHDKDKTAHATPWTPWTITLTAETGTITSYTANGAYTTLGGVCFWQASFSITNAGTGAGTLRFNPPVDIATDLAGNIALGYGIEGAVSGNGLHAFLYNSASTAGVRTYNFTTPIVTGWRLDIGGSYRYKQ